MFPMGLSFPFAIHILHLSPLPDWQILQVAETLSESMASLPILFLSDIRYISYEYSYTSKISMVNICVNVLQDLLFTFHKRRCC